MAPVRSDEVSRRVWMMAPDAQSAPVSASAATMATRGVPVASTEENPSPRC